jgi:hypothetical protein
VYQITAERLGAGGGELFPYETTLPRTFVFGVAADSPEEAIRMAEEILSNPQDWNIFPAFILPPKYREA